MLTTTNPEYQDKIVGITNHGRSPDLEAIQLGSNLRMSEVSASIGLVQLSNLDTWVELRRRNAATFTQALADHPTLQAPIQRPESSHAWHQYCVRTEYPDALVTHLDTFGIDARRYYTTPCHQQYIYKNHVQFTQRLENTHIASNSLVAIPVMHELLEVEIQRIVTALRSYR